MVRSPEFSEGGGRDVISNIQFVLLKQLCFEELDKSYPTSRTHFLNLVYNIWLIKPVKVRKVPGAMHIKNRPTLIRGRVMLLCCVKLI